MVLTSGKSNSCRHRVYTLCRSLRLEKMWTGILFELASQISLYTHGTAWYVLHCHLWVLRKTITAAREITPFHLSEFWEVLRLTSVFSTWGRENCFEIVLFGPGGILWYLHWQARPLWGWDWGIVVPKVMMRMFRWRHERLSATLYQWILTSQGRINSNPVINCLKVGGTSDWIRWIEHQNLN